jgi:hypothetical protein
LGSTPVVLAENTNGVDKSWLFASTASGGAAYGLIGVLASHCASARDTRSLEFSARRDEKAAHFIICQREPI